MLLFAKMYSQAYHSPYLTSSDTETWKGQVQGHTLHWIESLTWNPVFPESRLSPLFPGACYRSATLDPPAQPQHRSCNCPSPECPAVALSVPTLHLEMMFWASGHRGECGVCPGHRLPQALSSDTGGHEGENTPQGSGVHTGAPAVTTPHREKPPCHFPFAKEFHLLETFRGQMLLIDYWRWP